MRKIGNKYLPTSKIGNVLGTNITFPFKSKVTTTTTAWTSIIGIRTKTIETTHATVSIIVGSTIKNIFEIDTLIIIQATHD